MNSSKPDHTNRVSRSIELNIGYASIFAVTAAAGMLIYVLITIANILAREVFHNPLNGVYEVGGLIIGVVVASSFSVAFASEQHVRVSLVVSVVRRSVRRAIEVFAALITLCFLIFLSVYFTGYAWENFAIGERTIVAGVPIWPFLAIMAIAFVYAAFAHLVVLVGHVARCSSRKGSESSTIGKSD